MRGRGATAERGALSPELTAGQRFSFLSMVNKVIPGPGHSKRCPQIKSGGYESVHLSDFWGLYISVLALRSQISVESRDKSRRRDADAQLRRVRESQSSGGRIKDALSLQTLI